MWMASSSVGVSELEATRHVMEFDMPRIEEEVEDDEEEDEEEEEEEEEEFPYEEGGADGESDEEDEEAMFYEQQEEREMEASGAERMEGDDEGMRRRTNEGTRDPSRASGSKPTTEERCVDAKVVRNDLQVQEIHSSTRS